MGQRSPLSPRVWLLDLSGMRHALYLKPIFALDNGRPSRAFPRGPTTILVFLPVYSATKVVHPWMRNCLAGRRSRRRGASSRLRQVHPPLIAIADVTFIATGVNLGSIHKVYESYPFIWMAHIAHSKEEPSPLSRTPAAIQSSDPTRANFDSFRFGVLRLDHRLSHLLKISCKGSIHSRREWPMASSYRLRDSKCFIPPVQCFTRIEKDRCQHDRAF